MLLQNIVNDSQIRTLPLAFEFSNGWVYEGGIRLNLRAAMRIGLLLPNLARAIPLLLFVLSEQKLLCTATRFRSRRKQKCLLAAKKRYILILITPLG